MFDADAYSDLWTKVAALGHSLIRNRPLVDGNKRLGWVAMRVFLELNGVPPRRGPTDQVPTVMLSVLDSCADANE